MGDVKKGLKKSLKFTKSVYTGGFIKDAFGGGGKDPGEAQAQEIRDLYGAEKATQQQLFGQQTAAAQKAANLIPKAYSAARANIQVGKNAGLQGAVDRGAQLQAQAQQSLVSRGLYNSTVMDNASRGVSSQVTRDLADIEASYAQMLAQLDIGEGTAMAQAQQGLAGVFGQQAATSAGLTGAQAQALGSIQYQDPDAWLNSLLGIGGNIAGIAIGTSLGGGGGGPNVGSGDIF